MDVPRSMDAGDPLHRPSRRSLLAATPLLAGLATSVQAKDYGSRLEALNELDRLSGLCGMRLGTLRRSRIDSDLLASRFLKTLDAHRQERDSARRRFKLPKGADPATQLGEVDADLPALRQALDDLMIAYAESLPVFADATVVSRLAICMVEVSKLRTVIDLWVGPEAA